jgi:histidine ammonia-lyase
VGASGDLAPLSHIALALMGEGDVLGASGAEPAGAALKRAGLSPFRFAPKEGLAFINGTQAQTALLALLVHDAEVLWRTAVGAAAMSLEALRGTPAPLDPRIHEARPHRGQLEAADLMRGLLADSEIRESHRENDPRVQDAYSLRCAPQVAGAVRDTLDHAALVASRELAAAIDNPVVLPDGRVSSNGNFHGAPVAYVLDFLAIAVADLSSIAERRTDRMLDPARSHGLPAFLAADPGVDSGLMIAQYTQAGLVSDNKRLAVPASVDSIPSSAMQEDHVSMGWHAARKLRKAVENLRRVLAIELVTSARALDIRTQLSGGVLTPGPAGTAVVAALRAVVDGPGTDRFLSPELEAADQFVAAGEVRSAAESAVGALA